MEILTGHTPTQLLKMINDVKKEHDSLKQEIIAHTYEADEHEKRGKELEFTINAKIDKLSELEKYYVALIEELENKNAISQTDITEK
jgi:septal ring factor EnvC (AmiA/AmiB activator)